MWGLDNLLDNVFKADSQFGDVGDDIQATFYARVAQVEEYMSLINDNIMYYAAAVLDPRITCNLIREQCRDGANGIILRICEYFKKEYQQQQPLTKRSTDVSIPHNVNQHQLGLLRRVRKSNTSTLCDIDRYLDLESLD
jgi:hypothetical protein